ncbi:MAG: ribosome-binding factor A [Parcubacteria group bacterium]
MKEQKRERTAEVLRHLAAEFVRNESTDASLITITRVEVSPSGKVATIYLTTLPDDQQETAEKFLVRKTPEFKRYARDHSKIGILPRLDFKIDFGERNRQRLDELSEEE